MKAYIPVQMHGGGGSDHQAYLSQYGTLAGKRWSTFNWAADETVPAKFLKDQNRSYRRLPGLISRGLQGTCTPKVRRRGEGETERRREHRDGHTRGWVVSSRSPHARQQRLNAEERAALRREYAQTWVDEIHAECLKLRCALLPERYDLNTWAKLWRCFDHAEVELSNNMAENSKRPMVPGWKNWLHSGIAQSGPRSFW